MYSIINAAPRAYLLGIQDLSSRPPVREPEALPSHLPLIYGYAEKGPTLPQVVSGDELVSIYGSKTMDPRSPYYNHQSLLAETVLGKGNSIMFQRIVPDDAGPKARLLLSLDVVEDDIVQYERYPDGAYRYDSNGNKIPMSETKRGYRARWVVNDYHKANHATPDAFGSVPSRTGGLTATGGAQSTTYPILELEANFVGGYGNDLGLRITAPTIDSATPINGKVMDAINAALFRFTLLKRSDASTTPMVVETLQGEQFLDLALKPNAINTLVDSEVSLDRVLLPAYEDTQSVGFPPYYGPFGRIHVYHDNIELLLSLFAEAEYEAIHGSGSFSASAPDAIEPYRINPFTAVDQVTGAPYYALQIEGPATGGLLFTDSTVVYANEGADGTMSDQLFDGLVREQLQNWGDMEAKLLDDAVYPLSVIYDTGFSLDTKLAMLTPIGKRKDLYVVLSTQDVTQAQNSPSDETSIATSLRSAARVYPESEIYGTKVCRVIVIGQSGYLLNHKYKKLVTMTTDFAAKCAEYMGAGNGEWKSGFGFDVPPNNQVSMLRDVNATFKPALARSKDWEVGLVWVQNYDRKSLFYPAVQTVYDDDSSVLNSAINMIAAVELEKIALRTWRDLTGISNLTTEQFAARSDALISERTARRFDGRFVIKPETFYTAGDEQRGYSWSTKIHMYAPNMMSVGSYTITAHRISDLNQGS